MKKLILIAALMLSVVSFASETENVNLFNNQNSNDVVQNEKSVTEEKSNQELFTEFCNTTVWYSYTYTKVFSFDLKKDVYEVSIQIDQICTTCYALGNSGVSSSTNCLY